MRNLELGGYTSEGLPAPSAVADMSVSELKSCVSKYGSAQERFQAQQSVERGELEAAALRSVGTKYNLVANICHDTISSTKDVAVGVPANDSGRKPKAAPGVLDQGYYKCHLLNKATGSWFEIQDLHVSEVIPQIVGVSESNLLIYERK